MPRFTMESADALERAGIDLKDAASDFENGIDGSSASPGRAHRYGKFGVYRYERRIVFGRREDLVTYVWLGENV